MPRVVSPWFSECSDCRVNGIYGSIRNGRIIHSSLKSLILQVVAIPRYTNLESESLVARWVVGKSAQCNGLLFGCQLKPGQGFAIETVPDVSVVGPSSFALRKATLSQFFPLLSRAIQPPGARHMSALWLNRDFITACGTLSQSALVPSRSASWVTTRWCTCSSTTATCRRFWPGWLTSATRAPSWSWAAASEPSRQPSRNGEKIHTLIVRLSWLVGCYSFCRLRENYLEAAWLCWQINYILAALYLGVIRALHEQAASYCIIVTFAALCEACLVWLTCRLCFRTDYPCELIPTLNLVLFKTADPSVDLREKAAHLLQLLERSGRFRKESIDRSMCQIIIQSGELRPLGIESIDRSVGRSVNQSGKKSSWSCRATLNKNESNDRSINRTVGPLINLPINLRMSSRCVGLVSTGKSVCWSQSVCQPLNK